MFNGKMVRTNIGHYVFIATKNNIKKCCLFIAKITLGFFHNFIIPRFKVREI